ncbi:MAG TPA: diacylglycerol kinase family protein [Stellaceae bacterium]|nr:diacylglycerol kinase family protein [Stellaceae bacterium]
MPRRILIIVNPGAGRVASRRRHLGRVVAALRGRGCAVEVREAARAGDAESLARTAEPEFDVIVAAGGDGTVGAVVNGIADAPRPIAILPLGTANVLAAEIGLPDGAAALAEIIAEGPARPVWPGRIGGRLFLTSAGSGFDADVVAAVDAGFKRRGGKLAFVWAALTCLLRYRERRLTVTADGVEHHASAVIATTGPLYAGRFVVAPAARLDEPVLHLVLLRGGGRGAVLRHDAAMLLGRLPGAASVTIRSARVVTITGDAGAPVQADGDIAARLPVTLAIADRPTPIVQPAVSRKSAIRRH